MTARRLSELQFNDFLDSVAAPTPAPGAGPVGAFTLAMGVACARKAIAITEKHIGADDALSAANRRLAEISQAACNGADSDAECFSALLGAYRLPHLDETDRAARAVAIREGAAAVVRVAERLIGLGDAAREVVLGLRDRIDPVMINDVNTALRLIEANQAVQSDNLAENSRLLG